MRYLEYEMKRWEVGMSLEEVREALWGVQVSMLHDASCDHWYRMPSHFGEKARKLYRIFGVTRSTSIKKL